MKRKTKTLIYIISFLAAFLSGALIRIRMLGSGPNRLIRVSWNGQVHSDLKYGTGDAQSYDLYLPEALDKSQPQHLIVFIHGGSFNSGDKKDGADWCRYYASKGYITASLNYTLQKHGVPAAISMMGREAEEAVTAIRDFAEDDGIRIIDMAACGVSAGGTIAMNLAYGGKTVLPVRFVFQLCAPTYFAADEWGLLKKVDGLKSDDEFYRVMIGEDYRSGSLQEEIDSISPARLVKNGSVPTLLGYGLIDHCVPLDQKYYLIDSLKEHAVPFDYIEFPKSNHGMYNDPDKLQKFIDLSLDYCSRYFKS